jgi:hypothetical protein
MVTLPHLRAVVTAVVVLELLVLFDSEDERAFAEFLRE